MSVAVIGFMGSIRDRVDEEKCGLEGHLQPAPRRPNAETPLVTILHELAVILPYLKRMASLTGDTAQRLPGHEAYHMC